MFRFVFLVFGSGAYAVSFATILYAIGFVANLWVPKGIDFGAPSPLAEALLVNTLLLTVFALQHSVMARPRFKRFWTLVVPKLIRAQHVCALREPVVDPAVLAVAPDPPAALDRDRSDRRGCPPGGILRRLDSRPWVSTFLISHFELFGVKQVVMHWLGRAVPETAFRTPLLYNPCPTVLISASSSPSRRRRR